MHRAQRMSFSIESFFEPADTLIEVGARRGVILRLPLMKGEAESIQLGFESRQSLFETRIVLVHRGT
jgi:hypothetical protein